MMCVLSFFPSSRICFALACIASLISLDSPSPSPSPRPPAAHSLLPPRSPSRPFAPLQTSSHSPLAFPSPSPPSQPSYLMSSDQYYSFPRALTHARPSQKLEALERTAQGWARGARGARRVRRVRGANGRGGPGSERWRRITRLRGWLGERRLNGTCGGY